MSLRLSLAEIHLPIFVRKRELDRLFVLTGQAFETNLPARRGLALADLVELYARWTGAAAAATGARHAEVRERLRGRAFHFGRRISALLGLRTRKDIMRAARLLYRMIGIDFEGSDSGDIGIRRCSFSRHYTPEICALMSGLDEGVLAGLAGGGRLVFTSRMTEDQNPCRARFAFPEGLS